MSLQTTPTATSVVEATDSSRKSTGNALFRSRAAIEHKKAHDAPKFQASSEAISTEPWWLPYTELLRLKSSRPIVLLYVPSLCGTLMISMVATSSPSTSCLFFINCKLLVGLVMFREFGCIWNDFVDLDIDRQIPRTRNRPLARGAITSGKALVFAAIIFALAVLSTIQLLSLRYLLWELPSIVLIFVYPFCKRLTDFPQLVVGLTIGWNVFLAFPALDQPALLDIPQHQLAAASALFLACIMWVILYDTVYAALDAADDAKIDVRSTMVRFQRRAPAFLRALAVAQFFCILSTGYFAGAGVVFFALSLIFAAALGYMVSSVDLASKDSCTWWFSVGSLRVAGVMALIFVGEYISQIGKQRSACRD